jgi:predicted nucleotide-binding protein
VARIDPELLARLKAKLGIGDAMIYRRITAASNKYMLERPEAALALAADLNLNISKYSTREQRSQISSARAGVGGGAAVARVPLPVSPGLTPRRRLARAKAPRRHAGRGKKVFVVHGRDRKKNQAMFRLLRALDVQPIEWTSARALTGKANPYIGDILDAAFQHAAAVVVLMTPDDEAQLRESLRNADDEAWEAQLRGQPRQNVLFEAGAAMSKYPNATVFVAAGGKLRPFSDLSGRHLVHVNDQPAWRRELAARLSDAGVEVDTSGSDWLSEGDFS